MNAIPAPGEITGTASCPHEVQEHFGLGRYHRVAELVCGRVCAREMAPLGLTPDKIELNGSQPCPTACKEARVLHPPLGAISLPEPRPAPIAPVVAENVTNLFVLQSVDTR